MRAQLSAASLRAAFLEYFRSNGHRIATPGPLVPRSDPSLLFNNAGMVQFKDMFLGKVAPPASRVATVQPCVRAGGKHNDLDNVGFTARHHTLFEMCGNFAFDNVAKEEPCVLAWDFLTREVGLSPERLRVSVHRDDDETAQVWRRIGVSSERIQRGDEDNFWSMGDTGPCGTCTEIFVDQDQPDADGERELEVWNIVFMSLDRPAPNATPVPLDHLQIDTGMGLERLAAVLQGKTNNFDTDTFKPILAACADAVGQARGKPMQYCEGSRDDETTALRIMADHIRTASFLIAEGVTPSNAGRGYVCRRILRRAIRFAHLSGARAPVLCEAVAAVSSELGGEYSTIRDQESAIARVIRVEEEVFGQALQRGISEFDSVIETLQHRGARIVPGGSIFHLYDTYGFPMDLTAVMARERGFDVDLVGAEAAMNEQRMRARAAWSGSGTSTDPVPAAVADWASSAALQRFEFTGYTSLRAESPQVLAAHECNDGTAWMVVSPCPFYGEGGGQVGDVGTLNLHNGTSLDVLRSARLSNGSVVLRVALDDTALPKPGDILRLAEVDEAVRHGAAQHHTVTHLVHAALRTTLGDHVAQAGSLVAPDRLRFDFSHPKPVRADALEAIQRTVRAAIASNVPVSAQEEKLEDALASGAIAQFGDKYGDEVRVIDIPGLSKELCGGTHVAKTGDIGAFVLLGETSVASGTRRIEALAGKAALNHLYGTEETLRKAAELVQCAPSELAEKTEKLMAQAKSARKEVDRLKAKIAALAVKSASPLSLGSDGNQMVVLELTECDGEPAMVQRAANAAKQLYRDAAAIIVADGKTVAVAATSKSSVDANGILVDILGGNGQGGGSTRFALGRCERAAKEAIELWCRASKAA